MEERGAVARTDERNEDLGGKGRLKLKMVLTAEGTGLKHEVDGEIEEPPARPVETSATPAPRASHSWAIPLITIRMKGSTNE